MAKKVKLLKISMVFIVILALILTAVCVFIIKNKQKHETPKPTLSELELTELNIRKDVANNTVCTEYNGDYKINSVVDISFEDNLSIQEQNNIFNNIAGTKDKNSFANYLYQSKKNSENNEILCLHDGVYSKTKNNIKLQKGLYFGNLDKSYVYVENINGTIIINNITHSIDFEISKTAYWTSKNLTSSTTKIYVREKYYYDEISGKFFYVTYAYEQM